MTRAEALSAVVDVSAGIFDTPAKVDTFLALPDDEKRELMSGLKLAAKPPEASVWPKLLVAFGLLATVAGDVSGVAGAIAAIRAL